MAVLTSIYVQGTGYTVSAAASPAGGTTQPVYLLNGAPTATKHPLLLNLPTCPTTSATLRILGTNGTGAVGWYIKKVSKTLSVTPNVSNFLFSTNHTKSNVVTKISYTTTSNGCATVAADTSSISFGTTSCTTSFGLTVETNGGYTAIGWTENNLDYNSINITTDTVSME